MEFKQVVGNRRSIRYYKPYQPVEKDKFQTILEAARLQCQHGNAGLVRKAVVVTKGETDDAIREELIDALYNQPQAAQAPVAIVWAIDMSGWENLRENLLGLIDVKALTSSYGWSETFVEETVLKTADFNVLAGEDRFAEWLSAIEMGLAIGSALLAAVDVGLGTQLLTGRRDQMRELFGMPEHVTPAQIQIVGYPAEDPKAGGQRPRPPFEDLYFADTWGNSIQSDPMVVEELRQAGMFQEQAPVPWRPRYARWPRCTGCRSRGNGETSTNRERREESSMKAPTDGFLEELSRRSRSQRMDMPDTCSPEFMEYETVQRYADSLGDDLTEKERGQRLAVLEEFSRYVEDTPDEMVEKIFNKETRKYRKRGHYSDNAKAFAAETDAPRSVQLQRSNIIRAFFIANGYRLPPERPDWM